MVMGLFEKILFTVSFSVMILLLVLSVYSEKGIKDLLYLDIEEKRLEKENVELEKENMEIVRKIVRLKQDMGYIEHVARHELEMAAEDELVFRVRNQAREKVDHEK